VYVFSATSAAAVSYGHLEVAKLLLERGADPNITDNDNDTPLHVCETVECAELLLAANARLDAVNSAGQQVRWELVGCGAIANVTHPPAHVAARAGLGSDSRTRWRTRTTGWRWRHC